MAFNTLPLPASGSGPFPAVPITTKLREEFVLTTTTYYQTSTVAISSSAMSFDQPKAGLGPRAPQAPSSLTSLSLPTSTQHSSPSSPATFIPVTAVTAASISTTAATASASATTAIKEIYYPPASSHFALSVPSIIGIVVGGVALLTLLTVIAAFTVCFLDRKSESKAEREERKRMGEEAKIVTYTENLSIDGKGEGKNENENENESDTGPTTTGDANSTDTENSRAALN